LVDVGIRQRCDPLDLYVCHGRLLEFHGRLHKVAIIPAAGRSTKEMIP
jgi:hypothetical protein